ncbi:hypothetical protein GH714_012054 [Hevea brasiliensis]|uniref:Uncharacterized protein n=1 Tax=Hevea brasiliensis TaxID=3981 RepID=A0A6A6KQK1_HEVBR|nr:hypothetical protein GH714_012054 [Hevea brasiliensis]
MLVKDLVFLNLANNNLSGKIPNSIGWLSKLETLKLGNNALSGELPLSLKNCSRLRFIDLSGNKLSGIIPTCIGESLTPLQYLSLESNQFHGNIQLQLCQLTNVQILDFSVNNINGTIPHCIKNLRAMVDRTRFIANSTLCDVNLCALLWISIGLLVKFRPFEEAELFLSSAGLSLQVLAKLTTHYSRKISQLLVQITQMNEMISARKKIPVTRVG